MKLLLIYKKNTKPAICRNKVEQFKNNLDFYESKRFRELIPISSTWYEYRRFIDLLQQFKEIPEDTFNGH